MDFQQLETEKRNPYSSQMDKMSILEILKVMNDEDKKVAYAIEKVLPELEIAISHISEGLSSGGRLFYVGAGTSGRLGVLDALECPPTFMTSPDTVQAVLAGGTASLIEPVEDTEDDEAKGKTDLRDKVITPDDVIVGITASGRTPYPIGALKHAREKKAYTISISCNENAAISEYADCPLEIVVGPEVLTGSTRLKAGTAQKMVLNMMSTIAMVKLGKVYDNLMVDVQVGNKKLEERAKRILMEAVGITYEEAEKTLRHTNYNVKRAIDMFK